jgi:hypothetical protein
MTVDWPTEIIEQLDWHWRSQLRPRLDGLTDEEYLWAPTPGAWTIHPDAEPDRRIDWAYPAPDPAPVTTIAWRMAHIIVGCFGARSASHFGAAPVDYESFPYARTADAALVQLDSAYAVWLAGVRGWAESGSMGEPLGPGEGHFARYPRATLVLHINREVIHHGAEIALLRDLWVHRS